MKRKRRGFATFDLLIAIALFSLGAALYLPIFANLASRHPYAAVPFAAITLLFFLLLCLISHWAEKRGWESLTTLFGLLFCLTTPAALASALCLLMNGIAAIGRFIGSFHLAW